MAVRIKRPKNAPTSCGVVLGLTIKHGANHASKPARIAQDPCGPDANDHPPIGAKQARHLAIPPNVTADLRNPVRALCWSEEASKRESTVRNQSFPVPEVPVNKHDDTSPAKHEVRSPSYVTSVQPISVSETPKGPSKHPFGTGIGTPHRAHDPPCNCGVARPDVPTRSLAAPTGHPTAYRRAALAVPASAREKPGILGA